MGINFRVFKIREDFYSRVFFFYNRENAKAKLITNKVQGVYIFRYFFLDTHPSLMSMRGSCCPQALILCLYLLMGQCMITLWTS